LQISNGNTIDVSSLVDDADASTTNELQTISLATNTLSLSNGGGSVDLSLYLDDTDTQLTEEQVEDFVGGMVSGNTETLISVSYDDAGNSLDFAVNDDLSLYDNTTSGFLTSEVDGSTTNEIQTLDVANLTGTTLNLSLSSDGEATKMIELSGINTDQQTIDVFSFDGSILSLSLSNDQEATQTVDLSSLAGGGTAWTSLTGVPAGFADDVDNVDDADASASNELQTLSWSAGTGGNDEITLSDGGGTVTITDNVNDADFDPANELQTISRTGDNVTLSDGGGSFSVADDDADATNELQSLSIATNTLSLSDGGGSVDLSGYLDNTDAQDLSLAGNTLSLTGDGTTVDLSAYLDNTDAQALDLTGNTLTISGGAGSIDLSPYLDNTDTQLTEEQVEDFVGGMLSGNTESLISVVYDDASNHIDFTVESNLSNYTNDAGFLTSETDDQTIDVFTLAGNTLSISLEDDGETSKTVDLSGYLDNTDSQALNLTGNTLTISGGAGSIDLSPYLDNTDTQLSQAQVEDFAGGLFSGNTETLISATYQTADNTLDLVVENDLSLYDNTTSGFLTAEIDGSKI